jgi:hypothetical protein
MVLMLRWLSGRGVAGTSGDAAVGSGAKTAGQHPTVRSGNRTEQT